MSGGQTAVMTWSARSLWRNIEGSALVEATLLTPILMVLFFGVYEFSWYFYKQQQVIAGIRDAARYLAQASSNPCIPDPVTNVNWVTNAKNLATHATIDGSGGRRVDEWDATQVNITCNQTIYAGNTIYIIIVQTNFAFLPLPGGLFGFLGLAVPGISASHSERAIGGSV